MSKYTLSNHQGAGDHHRAEAHSSPTDLTPLLEEAAAGPEPCTESWGWPKDTSRVGRDPLVFDEDCCRRGARDPFPEQFNNKLVGKEMSVF
jgi:hypothetical protein